ncbi:hypothetical protein DL96DRAFT_1026219 [Flagelloscypha sp. PMI_526]|nr:hypothetical protein DL96DRAFT_1026219 [Flagelloscypha sp. PMI_526]
MLRATSRHFSRSSRRLPSFTNSTLPSATRACRRAYSSAAPGEGSSGKGLSFFNFLVLGGIIATGYGVYDTYLKPLSWPEEVKPDLRAGIKARQAGDFVTAESYFERAWMTAKNMPPEDFSGLPFLKISGIAVALAAIYEEDSNPEKAYDLYQAAFDYLQDPELHAKLSLVERLRAVGIASKLGEMAGQLSKPLVEQEKWLVNAVNIVVKAFHEPNYEQPDPDPNASAEMLAELDFPLWMAKNDVGAPFEALAEFYAKIGQAELAMPLYLQAVSILIPPPDKEMPPTSDEDVCRGGQIMNNIAELVIRSDHSPERLHQASVWAQRGLAKIETAMKNNPPGSINTCELALTAALFNNGAIAEYQGEKDKAKDLYERSLEQAEKSKMDEGLLLAKASLDRMERGEDPPKPKPPVQPRLAQPPKRTGWFRW